MCSPPASSAVFTTMSQSADRRRSASTGMMHPGRASAGLRSAKSEAICAGPTTVAPARASPSAMPRPRPRPAPVTMATRPVRELSIMELPAGLRVGRLLKARAGWRVGELRHDLLGERAQSLLRAGRVDQQHVVDPAGLQLLEARDDLLGRSQQRRLFAGEIGVGVRADVLIAFGTRPARQTADGLQHL